MATTPENPPSNQDKRQAAQQEALLREVDEAVREDQFAELAKRHGAKLGIAVVLGLVLLAGWLWWSGRQEAELGKQSEELILAIDEFGQDRPDAADRAFASLAESSDGGSRIVAQLSRAGIAAEAGRTDDAAKLYAAVAADSGAPQIYRDLATLREVILRYDAMKPADVEARLKPLAVPGGAWFGSAGELLAHAYLDQGKRKEAGELFRKIATDDKVPETIRDRTRQMAGSLGVDAVEDVDEIIGQQDETDETGAAQ